MRLTAVRFFIMPDSKMRVRNDLPVPLLPKTPTLRSAMRCRSMLTGMSSMSSGSPMWKWVSSSAPKTMLTSSSVAARTAAKWGGMVLTGRGSLATGSSTSIGAMCTVPKTAVLWYTSRRKGSLASGGML